MSKSSIRWLLPPSCKFIAFTPTSKCSILFSPSVENRFSSKISPRSATRCSSLLSSTGSTTNGFTNLHRTFASPCPRRWCPAAFFADSATALAVFPMIPLIRGSAAMYARSSSTNRFMYTSRVDDISSTSIESYPGCSAPLALYVLSSNSTTDRDVSRSPSFSWNSVSGRLRSSTTKLPSFPVVFDPCAPSSYLQVSALISSFATPSPSLIRVVLSSSIDAVT